MTEQIYDYKCGGTLGHTDPTYVKRQADDQIYNILIDDRYQACTVFNCRQMGKSSLIVKLLSKLQEDHSFNTALIDLTKIGTNILSENAWYKSFIRQLIRSFKLEYDESSLFCDENEDLSNPTRLEIFLDYLLEQIEGQILICIDEIDNFISLKNVVSSDDFFACLRSYINEKIDSRYERLKFCIIGNVTPDELIIADENNTTPFNNSISIKLNRFTFAEAKQGLLKGLEIKVGNVEKAETLLREILFYSGGQPFLTQCLCQLIVKQDKLETDSDKYREFIENLVNEQIIEVWQGKNQSSEELAQLAMEHLRVIKRRFVKDKNLKKSFLKIYGEILNAEIKEIPLVKADDTNREQIKLILTGLIINKNGKLRVFNPIYLKVFDLNWWQEEMKTIRPEWYEEKLHNWLTFNNNSDLLYGTNLEFAKEQKLSELSETEDKLFISESVRQQALWEGRAKFQDGIANGSVNLEDKQENQIISRIIDWTHGEKELFDKIVENVNKPINNYVIKPKFIEKGEEDNWVIEEGEEDNWVIEEGKEDDWVDELTEQYIIKNWKEVEVLKEMDSKIKNDKSEDELFLLLVTYGQILFYQNTENKILYLEGNQTQEELITLRLIRKRSRLNQSLYLQVANPIYEAVFNIENKGYDLHESDDNHSYIEQTLPDIRGYGKKLGMWLITQRQRYLLLFQKLLEIVDSLEGEKLTKEEHLYLNRSLFINFQRLEEMDINPNYMNQLVPENYKENNEKMIIDKIIERLTRLSQELQENNLKNPIQINMILIKWIKNIPEKYCDIMSFISKISQNILEKIKNYQPQTHVEDQANEETVVNELSIEVLVKQEWFIEGLNSSDELKEVSNHLKKYFSQLKDKTDGNIYLLIVTILKSTRGNALFVKLLVEYIIEEREEPISLKATNEPEDIENNIEKLWNGFRIYLFIDEQENSLDIGDENTLTIWEEKLTEDYQNDDSLTDLQKNYLEHLKLVKEQFDKNFWLVVTYLLILENKEILFESRKEKRQLLKLKLTFENNQVQTKINNSKNIWKVTNRIYEEIFNSNVKLISNRHNFDNDYPSNAQAIFNFFKSDRFVNTVTILNKFPNYIKTIIENTLFWTGRGEKEFEWTENKQFLTEKIFKFITTVIDREDELYPENEDDQEWFDKVIMYSLALGNKKTEDRISQKDFEQLIATRVSREENAPDRIHLRKSLQRFTNSSSQFKKNPLFVADLILRYTRDHNKVSQIVDYIINNDAKIANEEYFRYHPIDEQFYQNVTESLTAKEKIRNNDAIIKQDSYYSNDREEISSMQTIIGIIGERPVKKYLQAILLYDFTQKEVREYEYFSDNKQPEDEDAYQQWIGDGSGGSALEGFKEDEEAEAVEPSIKASRTMAKNANLGGLQYRLYGFENSSIIERMIEVDGLPFGVYFILKRGTPRGVMVEWCRPEILEPIVTIFVGDNFTL